MVKREREDILGMCQAFRASKILMAANEFDLFTVLSGGPMTASALSNELGAKGPKVELLLNALVALDLLEKRGNAYQNSRAAMDFLVKDRAGYVGHMLRHMNGNWDTWGGLETTVFGRKPVTNSSENFTIAMEENAYRRAAKLAEKVDLTGKQRLLDVGGSSGAYSVAFASAYPGLRAVVFDLPWPIEIARKLIEEKGMGGRVKTIEGDFEVDELGTGFDSILISNILHFQSENANKRLLKKAHSALQEGGTLIIHGPILDKDRTSPKNAAIFAIHMLLNSDGGRTYSWQEIEAWLKDAGFAEPQRIELTEARAIVLKK